MSTFAEFWERFKFNPQKSLMTGIERECILLDGKGKISPLSPKILNHLGSQNGKLGYELSACQLECRIGPCWLSELKEELLENEAIVREAERCLGFSRSFYEVAPDDMPLDIYPDPTGRYQRIVKNLPRRILLAACQIIATHVHIGMPDHLTALRVYNAVIPFLPELCQIGDHSSGKRLEIYKIMAPKYIPPPYNNWEDYYDLSVKDGFTNDPRSCWHLIRISVHGTIEFRMFGATDDQDKIVFWATRCHNLCQQAMKVKDNKGE